MKKIICCLLVVLGLIGVIAIMENQNVEAKGMYESSYSDRTAVRASHILVETKEEAVQLKEQIEANKITFEEAAEKYSKCPSGQRNGGDLGVFGRGQMVKPFEDAAFSLPIGVVSEPVKTQFGYHLIKVTSSR